MQSDMNTRPSLKKLVKPAFLVTILLVAVGLMAVSHNPSASTAVQREEMIEGVSSSHRSCIARLTQISRRSPRDVSAFPLSSDFVYHVGSRHLRAGEAQAESKDFLGHVHSVHKFIPIKNVGILFVYADNTVVSANDVCEISSAYAPIGGRLHPRIRGDVHRRLHLARDKGATPRPTHHPTRRPTTPRPTTQSSACTNNIRKDWLDLSQEERNLYVEGFRALRDNGRLTSFQRAHQEAGAPGADSWTAHGNAYFLPWHRYFLFELERQIRALGGKYACFNLPYWDWTRMSGQPIGNNPMFSDAHGIGGNGVLTNGYCVGDGRFSQASGYTDSTGACLRRQFWPSTIPNVQTTLNDIENNPVLLDFTGLAESRGHNNAHVGVGGRFGQIGSVPTATDDPAFWLLHCFVDLQYALWTDCHDYEKRSAPYPTNMFPDPDTVLRYPVLSNTNWAIASTRTLRARDFLKTSQLDYKYDSSDMISRSGLALGDCNIEVHTGRALKLMQLVIRSDTTAQVDKEIRDLARSMVKGDAAGDVKLAEKACVKGSQVAQKYGLKNQRCKYTQAIEKCPGSGKLTISLDALLAKKGVAANACLMNVRRTLYKFMNSLGTLRALCNGEADPVCESDNPY